MTPRILSEDCFKQPPGEEVWVLLCGTDERHWSLLGPYWTWEQLEAQLERSKAGCEHPHAYRKATLDDLADVDVRPSWINAPTGSYILKQYEAQLYLKFTYEYFPERLPYHDPI